jgi:hypothetical protein
MVEINVAGRVDIFVVAGVTKLGLISYQMPRVVQQQVNQMLVLAMISR